MSSTYRAFVPTRNLPANGEISRAMSSRGWAVVLPESPTLAEASGSFTIKVDGNPVELSVGVDAVSSLADADTAELGEIAAKVVKTTDVRISFSGTDEDSKRWSRDVARSVALLALGAFQDPDSGKTLHFGY
jgi:hypothetical protein